MSAGLESNGTWTAQVWYRDYHGDQRHKTKRGFASEDEALAWEEDFVGQASETVNSTFEDFYEVYAEDMKPRLREHTWNTKQYIIKNKILPFFGKMRVDEIEPIDVVHWQNKLMAYRNEDGQPYSQTYLRTINNQLSAMFNHAVRYYGLAKSPCLKTTRMESSKGGEMLFWTKDEYLRFAGAVSDKPESFYAFEILYWCGLRLGELLALTPADLDFARSELKVTKSYQRLHGRDVITPPKTPKSVRDVVMPEFLADELKTWVGSLGIDPDSRIFTFTKAKLHYELDRGCKIAHVKRIRVYDFRRSNVSLLIEMGFSAVAIADRLGHESSDITFRYAHLFPDKQNEMARTLDATKEGF
ncbi:MAG: site-specific integrase [Coriobacteriaceae bacterium]|nr:MAG: site-specific integrase [Coriobacteriaceae bacterium]